MSSTAMLMIINSLASLNTKWTNYFTSAVELAKLPCNTKQNKGKMSGL
jgi:hypothetical protein